jgi:hypothetical protein
LLWEWMAIWILITIIQYKKPWCDNHRKAFSHRQCSSMPYKQHKSLMRQ